MPAAFDLLSEEPLDLPALSAPAVFDALEPPVLAELLAPILWEGADSAPHSERLSIRLPKEAEFWLLPAKASEDRERASEGAELELGAELAPAPAAGAVGCSTLTNLAVRFGLISPGR